MKNRKVFIVSGSNAYSNMFIKLGFDVVDDIKNADVICFTGGSDVSPYMYDQITHRATSANRGRDEGELKIFNKYHNEKKFIGICRGAQFLNVMNGGCLHQDVDSHAIFGTHKAIVRKNKKVFNVTSTHHQMMERGWTGDIICTANGVSDSITVLWNGKFKTLSIKDIKEQEVQEIEAVYYMDSQSLCFQPHPEFGDAKDTLELFKYCLSEYLFKEHK